MSRSTVILFRISKDGFNKRVSASVDAAGALAVASYAFDTEGYDREFDLAVAAEHMPAFRSALGLPSSVGADELLAELQARFNTLRCDGELADFVRQHGIEVTQSAYTRYPDR